MITKINQNHRFLKIYRIKLANPSKFLTSDCEAVVRSQDASQGLRSSRAPCGAGRMACWKGIVSNPPRMSQGIVSDEHFDS